MSFRKWLESKPSDEVFHPPGLPGGEVATGPKVHRPNDEVTAPRDSQRDMSTYLLEAYGRRFVVVAETITDAARIWAAQCKIRSTEDIDKIELICKTEPITERKT